MRAIHATVLFAAVAAPAGAGGAALPPSCEAGDTRMANGVRLHYETSGAGGLPVVLVHGYGMSSAVWEKAMPLFPPECRLFALDLRGFGRSDKPEGVYGAPELAEDVAAFLDSVDISQAVLVGPAAAGDGVTDA